MTAPEGLAIAMLAMLAAVWLVRHRQYASVTLFGVVKLEMSDKPPPKPKGN